MVLNGKNVSKFNEDFIKNYDKDSDKGYIFEVDVKYPKNLNDLHSDLPFLPERMKINKSSKIVCNLYDQNNYVVHIRSLKQALDHVLILKKIHRVTQFNQEAWLKSSKFFVIPDFQIFLFSSFFTFHANIITKSLTIFVYMRLTRNAEIGNSPV